MNVLDYIILAAFAIGLILGLIKGFVKQILAIAGVILISTLTAVLCPYVQNWLTDLIANEGTRNVVALIVTVVGLLVIYLVIGLLVGKLLSKFKTISLINRIIGGVVALVTVYLSVAVIMALFNNTGDGFFTLLKNTGVGKAFKESWFANNLYKNNFFGKWLIQGIAQKLMNSVS